MGISMSGGPFSYNRFDDYQAMISEKKAAKDYDGDGTVESGTDEYMGSKDKAIKKAMAKEDTRMNMYAAALGRMGMSYVPMMNEKKKDDEPTDERKEAADRADEEKRQKKEGKKGEAHETEELEKIEDKELAKESFRAGWEAAMNESKSLIPSKKRVGPASDRQPVSMKEELESYDEEEALVLQALLEDGLANNIVSAEAIMLHMSEAWYQSILSEMGPAYPSETKAQATAQADHRQGKSSKGEKTGKNPGLKMSHTSGANRQD
jgi:hypothetical protein